MYIQPGQPTILETLPSILAPEDVLRRKRNKRLDTTSTPGSIYIGEAAINAQETDPVWVLGRWNGSALEYAQTPGAWTDRLTVAYGV